MHKETLVSGLLLLLVCMPGVLAEDYFLYDSLGLHETISNTMQIESTSSNSFVDYVQANLSYYPLDSYRQEVVALVTEPEHTLDNTINFYWDRPAQQSLAFTLDADIRTDAAFLKVKEKIPFPIQGLSNEFSPYLAYDEIIDTNKEIEQLAAQLAEGETDLFQVVYNVADWTTQHIEYNLSTKTAEASQPASWVLENREGVCDELTSLFLSMMRSLGIPAKFISGISYTNVDYVVQPWGPHGWAEVYFPGVGWVPFDVTYGEYGWLDAGHLKLRESSSPQKGSVSYEYRGRNIDLETTPLSFETTVLEKGKRIEQVVSLSASMHDPLVGFGSHNLVEVRVRNLKNYYVTEELTLGRTTRLEQLDPATKHVLLAPNEEKTIYWIVKVTPDLDPAFVYTFPVHVVSFRNTTAATEFKAQDGQGILAYDELKELVDAANPSLDPYARLVDLSCIPDKTRIHLNETVTVQCNLHNNGDAMIRLKTCFGETCKDITLPKGTGTSLELEKRFSSIGLQTIPISARGSGIVKTSYVVVNVLDEPALYISDITVPESVQFGQSFEMEFTITKRSASFPQNINIYLEHPLIRQSWHYDELLNSQRFKLITSGSSLALGQNQFLLTVHFEDEQGNQYQETRDFTITLEDPSLTEKLYVYLNMAGAKIDRFINDPAERSAILQDPKTWISVVVVILFIFAINAFFFIRRRLKGTEQYLNK